MTQWSTGQSLLALVVLLAVIGLLDWLAARHVQREVRRRERDEQS